MKTASFRDRTGAIYWTAFFDETMPDGRRVSDLLGVGDTEQEAILDLVQKEKSLGKKPALKVVS